MDTVKSRVWCVLFLAAALAFSCAGSAPGGGEEASAEPVPESFAWEELQFSGSDEFVPARAPAVLSADGVGELSREGRDLANSLDAAERLSLAGTYREAFAEGHFRGLDLAGVLGGDMVHGWPPEAPVTWVQNWRVTRGRANSWGIPSLVLAVRGLTHDRVFLVHGDILHAYGLGRGLRGANGAAGYGAPCGDEFMLEGRRAQRFDFGLLSFDAEGNPVFTPSPAPSLENEMPSLIGSFPADDANGAGGTGGADSAGPSVTGAFQTAWRSGIDSGMPLLEPDTPVITVDFQNEPWVLPLAQADGGGQDDRVTVRRIYYQGLGGGQVLFILADALLDISGKSFEIPPYPRIVSGTFLAALLDSGRRLKGADSLVPAVTPAGYSRTADNALTRALLDGIALYGIPLSAVLPREESGETTEAQRFSRGWFVRR